MSSLGIFLSAKALRVIPTKHLTQILTPIKKELLTNNLWLDEDDEKAIFDADTLSKYLRDNAEDLEQNIVDAFFYIDALVKGKMQDRIFVELSTLGETTLADEVELVSKLWCLDSMRAKMLYSEVRIKSQHSFTFSKPNKTLHQPLKALSDEKIASLENQLSTWFEANNKGRKAQVFQHDKKDKIFYHIQHGSTLKREAIIDGTESGVAIYRKEIEDILLFDKYTGEIGIYTNKKTQRLQRQYLSIFSLEFFSVENCYIPQTKFLLNTILQENFSINYGYLRDDITFFCIDNFEVELGRNSGNGIVLKSRKDALEVFNSIKVFENCIVKNIKFKITFSGEDKAKSFTIYSDKHSSYPKGCDHSLIDEILILNGICLNRKESNAKKTEQLAELCV